MDEDLPPIHDGRRTLVVTKGPHPDTFVVAWVHEDGETGVAVGEGSLRRDSTEILDVERVLVHDAFVKSWGLLLDDFHGFVFGDYRTAARACRTGMETLRVSRAIDEGVVPTKRFRALLPKD
jgi:hypothetical protein